MPPKSSHRELVTTWYGAFLVAEGRVVATAAFPSNPEAWADRMRRRRAGELAPEEVELLAPSGGGRRGEPRPAPRLTRCGHLGRPDGSPRPHTLRAGRGPGHAPHARAGGCHPGAPRRLGPRDPSRGGGAGHGGPGRDAQSSGGTARQLGIRDAPQLADVPEEKVPRDRPLIGRGPPRREHPRPTSPDPTPTSSWPDGRSRTSTARPKRAGLRSNEPWKWPFLAGHPTCRPSSDPSSRPV